MSELHLVGLTEIAHRAGVTNAAVANWVTRHDDFPEPIRILRCGPIWQWPQVAGWLTLRDMPDHAVRPLPPAAIDAAEVALPAPRSAWGALAAQRGISVRELGRAVTQLQIGEDFGWYTLQRLGAGAAK